MDGSQTCRRGFSSFQEAVDFLEKAVDYEKRVPVKYTDRNFSLGRMEALLSELGDPHRACQVIHIAGTKGKGSTAALVASCLREAGFNTGLHTSPHLVSVCERMQVNGRPAHEREFCRLLELVRDYIARKRRESRNDAPTYFETTTALAFKHFEQQDAEWAVVEVGLGGRLDSTNVVWPACCAVTSIGLDHTDKLGDTVEKIAAEKAGIFKQSVPVVLAKQRYPSALRVLRERAESVGCPRWEVGREVVVTRMEPLAAPAEEPHARVGWHFSIRTPVGAHDGLFIPMLGAHQVDNCATAIGCLDMLGQRSALRIEPHAIRAGVARCRWPARVEVLRRQPALVLDSAHTVESVQALLDALATHFPRRRFHLVFGCSSDKNVRGMLELLAPRCASLTTTRSRSPRAADAQELARLARELGAPGATAVTDCVEAVQACVARAAPQEIATVTGSIFVAGEVRHAWEQGAFS